MPLFHYELYIVFSVPFTELFTCYKWVGYKCGGIEVFFVHIDYCDLVVFVGVVVVQAAVEVAA